MDVDRLIQLWTRIRAGLLDTIDKFSDAELDYRPFDEAYSVRQIMLHIAQEELGEIQYGLTRDLDEFPSNIQEADFKTVSEVKGQLSKVHDQTLSYLGTLDADSLGEDFEAQWGEKRALIDFILHVIEHEVHHRGELSLILGLLGRKGYDA